MSDRRFEMTQTELDRVEGWYWVLDFGISDDYIIAEWSRTIGWLLPGLSDNWLDAAFDVIGEQIARV